MHYCTLNIRGVSVSFTYDTVEQLAPLLSAVLASMSNEGRFLFTLNPDSPPSSFNSSDVSSPTSSSTGRRNARRNFKRRERRRRKRDQLKRESASIKTGQSGARTTVPRALPEPKVEVKEEIHRRPEVRLAPAPKPLLPPPSPPLKVVSEKTLDQIRADPDSVSAEDLETFKKMCYYKGFSPTYVNHEIEVWRLECAERARASRSKFWGLFRK